MPIHQQTVGTGPDIVLLHGWGLHSGIWSATETNLLQHLSRRYRVTTIDLPGHGYSDFGNDGFTLATAVNAIAELVPPASTVIGWSLGGLVTIQLALDQPALVRNLILISSTARFSQTADWPAAMTTKALRGFSTSLLENQNDTVQRFLALQVHGSRNVRQQLRLLKQSLGSRPPARSNALRSGLTILEKSDLRSQLPTIHQPCLLLYGQHDRIVPPGAGAGMSELLPHAATHILTGAGHAPFLSAPETIIHLLDEFLDE